MSMEDCKWPMVVRRTDRTRDFSLVELKPLANSRSTARVDSTMANRVGTLLFADLESLMG